MEEKNTIDELLAEVSKSADTFIDAEVGRKMLQVIASPPTRKTRTKEKLAARLLKQVPRSSIEFSLEIVRVKYDTLDPKCNAYNIAFVGIIPDEQIPEEIKAEIEKAQS